MSEVPGKKAPAPSELLEERRVAILFDLAARDGRRVVEVRTVQPLGNGFYASPRGTLYSCAYSTQQERILALQRARLFCDTRGRSVVHFGKAEHRKSAWQ
jgi:hypothetical protein